MLHIRKEAIADSCDDFRQSATGNSWKASELTYEPERILVEITFHPAIFTIFPVVLYKGKKCALLRGRFHIQGLSKFSPLPLAYQGWDKTSSLEGPTSGPE